MTEVVKLISALPTDRIGKFNVDLTEFEEAAKNLQAQADRAQIVDEKSYAKGGDLIKVARSHAAKVEDLRKELTSPLHTLKTFIDKTFKGPKTEFDKVRATIEKKMAAWKREEDERRRKEAAEERKRLEEEALARAEQEKGPDDQDTVLDEASKAGEELAQKAGVQKQRGMYGSTGTRKSYHTEVVDVKEFLESLIALSLNREIDLGSVIEFRKSGLNKLAQYMLTERTAGKGKTNKVPGATFIEDESIRVY